jgi:hypothetical protein
MHLLSVLARNLSMTITAVALAAGFSAPALASPASRQASPNDTQEWGNDKVRVAVSAPSSLSVGPSGGTLQSSSTTDDTSTVDYCVEIDLVDASSGPYRLRFHVEGASGDSSSSAPGRTAKASRRAKGQRRQPRPTDVTLSFDLSTAADAYVTTTGDSGLLGAIYDADDNLIASDDSGGGRITAASLAAGDYSLVLDGSDDLTGNFTVTADQASCSDD